MGLRKRGADRRARRKALFRLEMYLFTSSIVLKFLHLEEGRSQLCLARIQPKKAILRLQPLNHQPGHPHPLDADPAVERGAVSFMVVPVDDHLDAQGAGDVADKRIAQLVRFRGLMRDQHVNPRSLR